MGFHRYDVPILGHDGKVTTVKGWIDETKQFGFYPMKRKTKNNTWTDWKYIASDIASGARIIECKTRKECVAWVEDNIEKIEKVRKTITYKKCVEKVRQSGFNK